MSLQTTRTNMSTHILLLALATTFLSLTALSAATTLHHRYHPAAAPHSTHTHSASSRRKGDERRPLEPYPGLYGSVDKCLKNLSEVCGREIFEAILGGDVEAKVSRGCCLNLVATGQRCHRKILKATIVLPEFSKRERGAIRRRGAKVWAGCVSVSDGLRFGNDSHYSPLPTPNS